MNKQMQSDIRQMTENDRSAVCAMMRTFYTSAAVWSNGSDEIFAADIDACLGESPYAEGYVFESGRQLQGYAMLAKSFSTEFGKLCIWVEDLYIESGFRGQGIGGKFLEFVKNRYPDAIFRLEVESENEGAIELYRRHGFDMLPYLEMKC